MRALGEISVQFIKGVGPARKKIFQNLGVESIEDLFYLFPRRYEDRSRMTSIAQLRLGEFQSVRGKVVSGGARRSWYTRKHVSEAVLDDKSGRIYCVWFNQPYLQQYFKPGRQVIVYGKVEVYKNRLQMIAPEYEVLDGEEDESLNAGRIVSIYPLTRGITQRYLRKVIRAALDRYKDELVDILPVELRNKHRLHNIKISLENIHFPESASLQEGSSRRVSFEEFFLFQISVIKRRMTLVAKPGIVHQVDEAAIAEFAAVMPFKLTRAQERVIREIAADMHKPSPMLRLLQGDVGSGKTLVAFFGCITAWKNHKQAAIMAPTEILARQHYENFQKMLKGFEEQGSKGFEGSSNPQILKSLIPKIVLLTSSLSQKEHAAVLDDIRQGKIDLVIGTHAVLSEAVDFKDLSFVVIDEQHKFGVRQRAFLSAKGSNPDVLVMTATPIPRTLNLTLYGDLDVSVLDELPPGRGKVETKLFSLEQSAEVYKIIREQLSQGRQAYVVYPIVAESETLDLKAAQKMFERFQKHEFKGFNVGLVHGQMKRAQAESVMEQFKKGDIQILVATTILEVGVDVANASLMVVEHAERFGLAQLHQLRGRIGRGERDGLCILVADSFTQEGNARLQAILATTDGFKIAEEDLRIRGPGHYFGRHQHGLNELRFVNPITQLDILQTARGEAIELTRQDPDLRQPAHRVLLEMIQKRYPGYLQMVEAG